MQALVPQSKVNKFVLFVYTNYNICEMSGSDSFKSKDLQKCDQWYEKICFMPYMNKKKIIYEQKKIIYEQKKIMYNTYEQKKSDQPA